MISTKENYQNGKKVAEGEDAIGRKILASSRTTNMKATKKSQGVDKGHFVIYTTDKRCFIIPLACLSNSIFIELLEMSEEEFGLSSDRPILLPCDSVFMSYIVLLIQRGLAKDLDKAVLSSFNTLAVHCKMLPFIKNMQINTSHLFLDSE